MTKRNKQNECYSCIHKRSVPGNAHIQCGNMDKKMIGAEHGKRNGWFNYPILFDPVWKERDCNNYAPRSDFVDSD